MDFRVDVFCCGVPLKAGSLIIGVVDGIMSVLAMVEADEVTRASQYFRIGGPAYVAFKGITVMIVCFHACKLVSACLLVFGVFMGRSTLALIWLLTHVMVCVVDMVASTILGAVAFGTGFSTSWIALATFVNIVRLVVAVYFFVVVRSYYMETCEP